MFTIFAVCIHACAMLTMLAILIFAVDMITAFTLVAAAAPAF
jgi:hypothetical protein